MPLHWPGHNYLGPGTYDFTKEPVDKDDAIAREHDLAYSSALSNEDIYSADKKAIGEFWNNFTNTWNIESGVAAGVLKGKNFLEESILHKPIYGMSNKRPGSAITADHSYSKKSNMGVTGDDIRAPVSPNGDSPMDIQADAPNSMSANSGGSGSSGAVAGSQMSDIFAGSSQGPNKSIQRFKKSYHFTISNDLPEHRRFVNEGHIEFQTRFNAIHGIPWELLAMYCSEGEISRLRDNFSMAKVLQVKCSVFSLGVRLPFVTGQSVSTVANANAQYPIGQFNFDNDFYTQYEENNVYDIIDKCWGTEWKDLTVDNTTEWSKQFDNLTASATSRDFRNPTIVIYPRAVNAFPGAIENWPKDVGIYDYCNIKNGSTAYGKCFEMVHRPKHGIIFSTNSTSVVGAEWPRNGDGLENTPIFSEQSNYAHNTETIATRNDDMGNYTMSHYRIVRARNPNSLRHQHVENTGIYGVGSNFTAVKAMPKFLIGLVNIRNQDDSLLEAKWDILVQCEIEIECIDNGQRGFINRIRSPVPYAMNPFLQQSDYSQVEQLIPNMNLKNVLYGKGCHKREVTANITLSKEVIDKLKENDTKNKTKKVEKLKKRIQSHLENAIKHYNVLSKHKQQEVENDLQFYKDILKNF